MLLFLSETVIYIVFCVSLRKRKYRGAPLIFGRGDSLHAGMEGVRGFPTCTCAFKANSYLMCSFRGGAELDAKGQSKGAGCKDELQTSEVVKLHTARFPEDAKVRAHRHTHASRPFLSPSLSPPPLTPSPKPSASMGQEIAANRTPWGFYPYLGCRGTAIVFLCVCATMCLGDCVSAF